MGAKRHLDPKQTLFVFSGYLIGLDLIRKSQYPFESAVVDFQRERLDCRSIVTSWLGQDTRSSNHQSADFRAYFDRGFVDPCQLHTNQIMTITTKGVHRRAPAIRNGKTNQSSARNLDGDTII